MEQDFKTLIEAIRDAAQAQADHMGQEIEDQGHVDTRELVDSLTAKAYAKANGDIRAEIYAADHGVYVSGGVPAENVKYNPIVIVPWVMRNLGIVDEEEALSVAYAIKTTHQETGIPSPGSYAFTKNGFRTQWIERSINSFGEDFTGRVNRAMTRYANALVAKLLQDHSNFQTIAA